MSSIKEIKNQIENANALGIENLVEKGVIVGGRPTPTGIKPPTTYDIMAAISNIPSSEGGATLNVAFGDTAPDDTGKLWVKAEEPSEITYGSGIDGVLRVNGTSACLRYNSTDPPCAAKIDNKIYIFRDKAVFIYDTNTNAVADLGDILPEALYGSFCYAENNKIYLIGGSTTGNYYVFDPETQKATVFFTTGYDTKIDSGYSKIGNKLFKFGGQSSKDIVLIDLEVNGSGQYLQTQLPVFLRNMCCEAYGKKVYLFGGYGGSSLSNSQYRDKIYAFDTEDYTLRALEITLPEPCDGMCSCRIGTKIYLFGGSTASGRLNKINVFDIEKETIETLEATLLNADTNMGCCGEGTKIYLFGGYAYPETINGFVLTHQLQKGNVEIEASPLKNRFNLINTDNAQVQVGVENVYVGNESNEAELCDAYLYKHFEKLNVDKHFTSEAFQVDSATTLSAAVNCSVGDLVIAAIITRDSLNISDGWTLISTSAVNSTDANGQRLSFAYKYATGENEGITVTQASAQRLYINIVALQGATGFVDNGYSYVDT